MTTPQQVRPLNGVDVIGYVRVSSERQASDDKVSLEDQRTAIQRRAEGLRRTVGAWFSDPGASGGSFEKRDGMAALIASCEAQPRSRGSHGLILVLTASRFGRPDDPEESAYWRHRLKRSGWIVRYCVGDDAEDLTTKHLMRAISDVGATKERNEIRRRAVMGARGATEQGYWKGGAPPFGFTRKAINPRTGAARILAHGVRSAEDERVKLHPDESGPAQLVREMFVRYAAGGIGMHGIAAFMAAEWPAASWTHSQCARMLKNRVYVGDLVSGRKSQAESAVECIDAHPPIVERALFDRVQARLKQNGGEGRGIRGLYPLTGLVRCAICGAPLIGAGSNGRVTRDGHRQKYYRCRGASSNGTPCHMGGATVQQVKLEAAVRRELTAEFASPVAREAVWRAIEQALDARSVNADVRSTDALDRAIADTEKQIQRVIAGVARELYSEDEAAATLRDLRGRLNVQKRERADVVRLADHQRTNVPNRGQLRAVVDAMPQLLETLTGGDLRGAIAPWVAWATFDPRGDRPLTIAVRTVPVVGSVGFGRARAGGCDTSQPDAVRLRVVNLGRGR